MDLTLEVRRGVIGNLTKGQGPFYTIGQGKAATFGAQVVSEVMPNGWRNGLGRGYITLLF